MGINKNRTYRPSVLTARDVGQILLRSGTANVAVNEGMPLSQESMRKFVRGQQAPGPGRELTLSIGQGEDRAANVVGLVLPVVNYLDADQGIVTNLDAGRVLQVFMLARHLLIESDLGDHVRCFQMQLTKFRESGSESYNNSSNILGYAWLAVADPYLSQPMRFHRQGPTGKLVFLDDRAYERLLARLAKDNGNDDDDGNNNSNGPDEAVEDLGADHADGDGDPAGEPKRAKADKRPAKPRFSRDTAVDLPTEFRHCLRVAMEFFNLTAGSRRHENLTPEERHGRATRRGRAADGDVECLDRNVERVVDAEQMAIKALAGDTRAGGTTAALPIVLNRVMAALVPQAGGDDFEPADWFQWEIIVATLRQHWGDAIAQQLTDEWWYCLLPLGQQWFPMCTVFAYGRSYGWYQNAAFALLPNNSRGLRLSTLEANLGYVRDVIDTPAYPQALRQLFKQHSTVLDDWARESVPSPADTASLGPLEAGAYPQRSSGDSVGSRDDAMRATLRDARAWFVGLVLMGLDPTYTPTDGFGFPKLEFGPGVPPDQIKAIEGRVRDEMTAFLDAVQSNPVIRQPVLPIRPNVTDQHAEFHARLTFFRDVTRRVHSSHGCRVMADFCATARDGAIASSAYQTVSHNLQRFWGELVALRTAEGAPSGITDVLGNRTMQGQVELYGQAVFAILNPEAVAGYRGDGPQILMGGVLSVWARLVALHVHWLKYGGEASGKGTADAIVTWRQRSAVRDCTVQGMGSLVKLQNGAVTVITEMQADLLVPMDSNTMSVAPMRHMAAAVLEGKPPEKTRSETYDRSANDVVKQDEEATAKWLYSANLSDYAPDRALMSRFLAVVMATENRLVHQRPVARLARQHTTLIEAEFQVQQSIVQMLGGLFHHKVLPMTTPEDNAWSELAKEALDLWAREVMAPNKLSLDNRTRSSYVKVAHFLAWAQAIKTGLRLALDNNVFGDLSETSPDAVLYVVLAFAQEYRSRLQTGAVYMALDLYLETMAGASLMDGILCAARVPGHSFSFVANDVTAPGITLTSDALRSELGTERMLRVLADRGATAWPMSFHRLWQATGCNLRSITSGRSRRRGICADSGASDMDMDTDGDGDGDTLSSGAAGGRRRKPQRVIVMQPANVGHAYPFAHRAMLCVLLHQTLSMNERAPKTAFGELVVEHADSIRSLQTYDGVLEAVPVRVEIQSDPTQALQHRLRAWKLDLDSDRVLIDPGQFQELCEWRSQSTCDAEFSCFRSFEIAPWRLVHVFNQSTFLDYCQKALGPHFDTALLAATYDELIASADPLTLAQILARCPGLTHDYVVKLLQDLDWDVDQVLKRPSGRNTAWPQAQFDPSWALLQRLRQLMLGGRTADITKKVQWALGSRLQTLCKSGLGTLAVTVYPRSKTVCKLLTLVVRYDTEESRQRHLDCRLAQQLFSYRLRPAQVRIKALTPRGAALFTGLPALRMSLYELQAECHARYGYWPQANEVEECFSAVHQLTSRGLGRPAPADLRIDKLQYVHANVGLLTWLYASLSGSVLAAAEIGAQGLEHNISEHIHITTVEGRDPLDWGRPAAWALLPDADELAKLVADPPRLLRESQQARVFAGLLDSRILYSSGDPVVRHAVRLMRDARRSFRPLEQRLARRAADGADGSFMYVPVSGLDPHEEDPDVFHELTERWKVIYSTELPDRGWISAQQRVKARAGRAFAHIAQTHGADAGIAVDNDDDDLDQLALDLSTSPMNNDDDDDDELALPDIQMLGQHRHHVSLDDDDHNAMDGF